MTCPLPSIPPGHLLHEAFSRLRWLIPSAPYTSHPDPRHSSSHTALRWYLSSTPPSPPRDIHSFLHSSTHTCKLHGGKELQPPLVQSLHLQTQVQWFSKCGCKWGTHYIPVYLETLYFNTVLDTPRKNPKSSSFHRCGNSRTENLKKCCKVTQQNGIKRNISSSFSRPSIAGL